MLEIVSHAAMAGLDLKPWMTDTAPSTQKESRRQAAPRPTFVTTMLVRL